MGFFDIVAAMCKSYRQSIIFNIENDDLEVSAGLVEVYHGVLTEWLNDEDTKLAPRPAKSILSHIPNNPDTPVTYKFESTYHREIFDWLFTHLQICEEGFTKHLYTQKQMFPVMQVAVTDYRNALLFQLQKGKQPKAAIWFVRIMNALLPEDYRVQLSDVPNGNMFSDHRDEDQRDWCIKSLKEIDRAIAKYIQALKFLGST